MPNNSGVTPIAAVTLADTTSHLFPGQTLRIGRDPTCDLVPTDPRTSRLHLLIQAGTDGTLLVQDMASANGTFHRDTRVTACQVLDDVTFGLGNRDGDQLVIQLNRPTGQLGPTVSPQPAYDVNQFGQSSGYSVLVDSSQTALGIDITIGRAPDNTIVLDDPLVSRYHARLTPTPGGYRVVDLNSLNGIQLNGRAVIGEATFTSNDRLTVGRSALRLSGGQIVRASDELGGALIANNLSFTLRDGKPLLRNISFAVPAGNLVAVIGPSGAGKSTLLRAITGSQPATEGGVVYQGQDLYRNFASLRQLIGVVPQDDVVHRQLTVRQALGYAAELRLPGDYTRAARDREVSRVIRDLKLDAHQTTQVSRLSGGQRKRTSVAMELLTQPPLLLLDEPTSGLDPGLDLDVMRLLREQADGGRTVLVVTHSTDNLDLCDLVLILAPGGMVAYFGPPNDVLPYFGSDRYASVFTGLAADPQGQAMRWAQTHAVHLPPPDAAAHAVDLTGPRQRFSRQWSTLIRRQLRIIVSDRSYALSAALLPVIIAAMTLVIPGDTGFGKPPPDRLGEPSQLLVIITVGAAFMGMSTSIRELISERPIFLRERTVGLSPMVYLSAKVFVLIAMTLLQSALLITVVRLGKPGPDSSIWASDPTFELWLAAFGTAYVSALLGLLLSALVGTGEQTMPALVITIMAQLVFCGGLITITDRGALEAVAALFPSRWGFAQAAATIDLRALNPTVPSDPLWEHTAKSWLTAAAALCIVGAMSLVLTAIRLVRQPSAT